MSRPLRVLIVEDSEDDAALLLRELRRGGYDPLYERVDTAAAMKAALNKQTWDIIVSDYSMPQFTAPAALKLLQESTLDLPFIIVSGAIGEDAAVAAMKAGVHDYVMKGSLARLVPAIERELREAEVRRERNRVEEENQHNLKRLRALHEIDVAIASTLDLRAVLDILLEKIDSVLPNYATIIRLFNLVTRKLEAVAHRNSTEEEWERHRSEVVEDLPQRMLEDSSLMSPPVTRLQPPPQGGRPMSHLKLGPVSYLRVPLVVKGNTLGFISFSGKEGKTFSNKEGEFLATLAGQAAIAIHNSQLYEQTKNQASELQRANKVKDEFLSVMSHELRTPLSVIMGYTGMIKDRVLGEINPKQEETLGKVICRSEDLLSMLSGILQATSIEAGETRLEPHEVNLGFFLTTLRSSYDRTLAKTLTLNWDYPPDLPVVKTDSEKLKHILQNLVNNAVKFTDEGAITISARYVPQAKAVEFKVTDTGIGIPRESFPMIFEKFRQVDSSETRSYGGVGLGLYIVKNFTELLGGTLAVESAPGVGSTFTVTIPTAPTPAPHGC